MGIEYNSPTSRLNDSSRAALLGSFIQLRRGFVHYEIEGPADGPPLILVGGLSVPYSTWDRTSPALAAAGYRVLRYDHFGRGYSDRPRGDYSLQAYVQQLAELVEALKLPQARALVGLSMGGPVVAASLLRNPSMALSAVFIDPLILWPRPRGANLALACPFLGDLVMALNGPKILTEGQRSDFSREAEFKAFIPSYLPQFAFAGIPRAVLNTMRGIPRWPLEEIYSQFGRLGLQSLLFWGREDKTLPFEDHRRFLAAVPDSQFLAVPNAGHVPQWEAADLVNSRILSFLRTGNRQSSS